MERSLYQAADGAWGKVSFEQAFPFLLEKGHVVSIVGAGGKSTILYELAKAASQAGIKTLVGTTTHIWKPEDDSYTVEETVRDRRWSSGQFVVTGEETKEGKLIGSARLLSWMKDAELVLLEADGAKHKPFKIPKETEPVLPLACDIVICVAGMSAYGTTLEESCFRYELADKIWGFDRKKMIDEEVFSAVLSSESGMKKDIGARLCYLVLNQCDSQAEKKQAKRLAARLTGYHDIYIAGRN